MPRIYNEYQSFNKSLISFENFRNFNIVKISVCVLFQFLHCQTWRQGLFQLLHFLFVCDEQIGVKVYAASNFKLHIIFVFLDFDRLSILFPDCDQISSILRGMMMRYREHSWNKEWQETRRREKYKSLTLKWIRDLSRQFAKDITHHIFMRATGLMNRCLTWLVVKEIQINFCNN